MATLQVEGQVVQQGAPDLRWGEREPPQAHTFAGRLGEGEILAVVGIGLPRQGKDFRLNVQFQLEGAIGKHLHRELLLLIFQLQARLHGQPGEASAGSAITELQEDRCAAGVGAHLHTQDTLAGPLLPHMLQAVDRRAGEDDVNVGQHKEHEQGLWEEWVMRARPMLPPRPPAPWSWDAIGSAVLRTPLTSATKNSSFSAGQASQASPGAPGGWQGPSRGPSNFPKSGSNWGQRDCLAHGQPGFDPQYPIGFPEPDK